MKILTIKFISFFFIFLFICVPCVSADEVPVEPETPNVEQHGFWYEVFWGTASDPGVFREILDWGSGVINGIGDTLVKAMISAFNMTPESYSTIVRYFQIAERWVPLSFFFTMLFSYWAFLGVFTSIKFLLKLIPFIG